MPKPGPAARLRAGWARADLTPPLGLPMAGYLARQTLASGVLDPLSVRCLALAGGRQRMLFVAIEWLAVEAGWCDRLRARLARQFGLPRAGIIVAATHTHSGPAVPTGPFVLGPEADRATRSYLAAARHALDAAAAGALAALAPVAADWARTTMRGVAGDRNRRGVRERQPLLALRLRPLAGGAPALLAVYGCHPTVLGPGNSLYSGDLFGELARGLESRGGYGCALLANGAAANISTRFTRRERTPAEVRRLAASSRAQIARLRWRALRDPRCAARVRRLALPLRGRDAPPLGTSPGERVWAALRRAPLFARRTLSIEAILWRIGPLQWAALPLEVFADTGDFFWRQDRTQVLGYANGYWGYLPSRAARADDYEAISSPFTRAADAVLRRALVPAHSTRRNGARFYG